MQPRSIPCLRIGFGLTVFALIASADQITVEWTVTSSQIIPNPPGASFTDALGINDQGVVLLDPIPGPIFTTWDGSSFHQYSPPSGFGGASGVAINNLGVIAGTAERLNGQTPTLWYPDGSVVPLAVPGTFPAYALGINNRNQVLIFDGQPLIWDAGVFTSLNGLPGYLLTHAYGINDTGLVAGDVVNSSAGISKPVFWAPGSQDPTVLPCNSYGTAWAANNLAEIAGTCGTQAVVWDAAGNMRVIGSGTASGINDRGEVVGYDGLNQAFFWSPVYGFTHITQPNGLGFVTSYAAGIDKNGVVVASGEPSTIIPEPATVGLAALTLLLVFWKHTIRWRAGYREPSSTRSSLSDDC